MLNIPLTPPFFIHAVISWCVVYRTELESKNETFFFSFLCGGE